MLSIKIVHITLFLLTPLLQSPAQSCRFLTCLETFGSAKHMKDETLIVQLLLDNWILIAILQHWQQSNIFSCNSLDIYSCRYLLHI